MPTSPICSATNSRPPAPTKPPFNDEVAFVRKYLDLEKARFGERLRIRFDIADDTLDCVLPPMLLQPLVENAVRHGLASLIDGGEVRVSIHRQNEQLHVEIADTGVGMNNSTETGNGVGLTNTRLRLEKMYGTDLVITPNVPHGVVVRFELPVKVEIASAHRQRHTKETQSYREKTAINLNPERVDY